MQPSTNPKAGPEEVGLDAALESEQINIQSYLVGRGLTDQQAFVVIRAVDKYARRVRQATIKEVVERLKREGPEDLAESAYKLNMGLSHNPPSDTTRTNLARSGFNQANAQWRAALKKIEEEMV